MEPLVADLKARKDGAARRLVEEYSGMLYAGALALGFQRADAESLVADALSAFLEGLDRFEGRSALKTYLFGILHHKGSELRRSRGREEGVEDVEALFDARFDAQGLWVKPPRGPEQEALDAELKAVIARCAEALPLQQRAAFHLREVEREGTASICNILGVTPTNLGVLLFRARAKLRECLERSWA